MRVQRQAVCSILLAILVGCGGSGSSGFDPTFAEGPLIQQAIDEQRCVRGDGTLTICPSGASVPNPMGGVLSPTDIRVSARVERADFVDCSGAGEVSECSVTVAVETAGLPPDAEIRIATRPVPDGSWSVGAALEVAASGASMPAPVTVELAGDAGAVLAVQVAVLVFSSPPAAVPAEVDELRETGAAYAFVLPPVQITSPSSP